MTAEIDCTKLYGFDPDSPYAQLFVDVFHLTRVKTGSMRRTQEEELEIEDGEIEEIEETEATKQLLQKKKRIKRKKIKRDFDINLNNVHHSMETEVSHSRSFQNTPKKKPDLLPLQVQFNIDEDPVRLNWLYDLLNFLSSRGRPLHHCPAILVEQEGGHVAQPIDLFMLFHEVALNGGYGILTANHGWGTLAHKFSISPKHARSLLRKIYTTKLLDYENFKRCQQEEAGDGGRGGKNSCNDASLGQGSSGGIDSCNNFKNFNKVAFSKKRGNSERGFPARKKTVHERLGHLQY